MNVQLLTDLMVCKGRYHLQYMQKLGNLGNLYIHTYAYDYSGRLFINQW